MATKKPQMPAANAQDMANDAAAIQHALMVLGHCLIARHSDGTYVLHGIQGGIHVVAAVNGAVECRTDNSLADEHTAIVTLYRLRWEDY